MISPRAKFRRMASCRISPNARSLHSITQASSIVSFFWGGIQLWGAGRQTVGPAICHRKFKPQLISTCQMSDVNMAGLNLWLAGPCRDSRECKIACSACCSLARNGNGLEMETGYAWSNCLRVRMGRWGRGRGGGGGGTHPISPVVAGLEGQWMVTAWDSWSRWSSSAWLLPDVVPSTRMPSPLAIRATSFPAQHHQLYQARSQFVPPVPLHSISSSAKPACIPGHLLHCTAVQALPCHADNPGHLFPCTAPTALSCIDKIPNLCSRIASPALPKAPVLPNKHDRCC